MLTLTVPRLWCSHATGDQCLEVDLRLRNGGDDTIRRLEIAYVFRDERERPTWVIRQHKDVVLRSGGVLEETISHHFHSSPVAPRQADVHVRAFRRERLRVGRAVVKAHGPVALEPIDRRFSLASGPIELTEATLFAGPGQLLDPSHWAVAGTFEIVNRSATRLHHADVVWSPSTMLGDPLPGAPRMDCEPLPVSPSGGLATVSGHLDVERALDAFVVEPSLCVYLPSGRAVARVHRVTLEETR